MLKRIGTLFRKDLILGIKDVFVLLEVAFAVLIVLLLLFVVPKDIRREAVIFIHDATGMVEGFVRRTMSLEAVAEKTGEHFVKSRDEVIAGMRKNRAALGLLIGRNSDGTYDVRLLTQPYTTRAIVRYIELDMEDLLTLITPPFNRYPPEVRGAVRVTALRTGARDEIPFNQRLLPAILLMMVGIVGLFIMISMTGEERLEGTLKAFRISPAAMGEFLASKHLLLLAVSFATFSIIYLPVMGFAGYLPALAIILLTVLLGSAVGVILGAIFDTPMASMMWVLSLMVVLGLPAVSLYSPVFSPAWLKLIPSYYTLFGLDAAMFPEDNARLVVQALIVLGGLDVVLLLFSSWLFGRLVGKEA